MIRLDLKSLSGKTSTLFNLSNRLVTKNTTTPFLAGFFVLRKVVSLNGREKGGESSLVTWSDIGDSNTGGSLLVNESSQTGLTLNNGIRNTNLLAERWKEYNKFNWINIIGNQNELWLLVFNKGNNVLKTILNSVGLFRDILSLLAFSDGSSFLFKTSLLFSSGFWSVVVQKLESLSSSALIKNVLELGNRWRDLKAKRKNLLLSLKTDVSWPLNKSVKVALRLDTVTNTKWLRGLIKSNVNK